jgi:hypothetical protein
MREMTVDQRREHVKSMEAKRSEIQTSIANLNVKRQQFVEAEMKKNAENQSANSFDSALRKAIREQAAGKGFAFEQPRIATNVEPDC